MQPGTEFPRMEVPYRNRLAQLSAIFGLSRSKPLDREQNVAPRKSSRYWGAKTSPLPEIASVGMVKRRAPDLVDR
jgi:hypothetical protein